MLGGDVEVKFLVIGSDDKKLESNLCRVDF